MGHLINPVSVRLGFSTFWISSWSIVNLNFYSYFVLLDNLIIELISFFFYHSAVIDRLSRFGFFFSHFRLVRRHLGSFGIKLFFVQNSTNVLPKTFVELVDRERFNFGSLLGFKFLRLSKLIRVWIKNHVGRTHARSSLFRLRRPKFFSGEQILKLRECFLFQENKFSWKQQKKKKIRLVKIYERLFPRYAKRIKFRSIFYTRFKLKKKKFQKAVSHYQTKTRSVLLYARTCKKLFKQLINTSGLGSLLFGKVTLKDSLYGGALIKNPRLVQKKKMNKLRRYSKLRKKKTAFFLSQVKVVRSRFLAAVVFARLRKAYAVTRFFKYLASLYSELVSKSLHQVGLFQKLGSKAYAVSLSFSLLHRFKLLNPQFVSRFIAKRLTYGIPLRRVLKPVVTDLAKSIANPSRMLQGFRIKCSGRFNRAQMASVTVERRGSVPLNSISTSVGLGYSTAFLRYGACGIKVWFSSKKWAANSSAIDFNKLTTLKLLNSVVLRSKKYICTTYKSIWYSYLVCLFILNLLPFKEGFDLDDEKDIPEDLELAPKFIGLLYEEDVVFKQFLINSSVVSNSILFSFLMFCKWVRSTRRKRLLRLKKKKLKRAAEARFSRDKKLFFYHAKKYNVADRFRKSRYADYKKIG